MDRGGVGSKRGLRRPRSRGLPRPRSRAAEAMSRTGVLGGQLAMATERPVQPSARAGFLEETLAAMVQAQR
jgi:hypothetical protein